MKLKLNRYIVLMVLLLLEVWQVKASEKISLITALQKMEDIFHVNFNYNSATVAGKFVNPEQFPSQGVFNADKVAVALQPLGLTIVKLGSRDYAIQRMTASPTVNIVGDDHKVVNGTISNDKGEPVPGATITDKETNKTVVADDMGRYTIEINGATTLVVHSVGFVTKEVKAGANALLNIQLLPDVKDLSAVVVTALGIRREEKALGYSIATLDGSKVNTVKDVNLVNSLSGKVAGVDIRSASSDPGGSVLITIRGTRSIMGFNAPLFVVDGVPVASANRTPGKTVGDVVVDYGSPISDVNPDDIASVTVLKGASASALYGSRAGNGVILITTKTGNKGKKGLGVSANFSALYDKAWQFPDFQSEFGAGDETGASDPKNTLSTASWGPKLNDGSKHLQWNSPTDANGDLVPTDWIAYPNRVKDFYQTGSTYTSNVAVTGNNFRLSYTNLQNKGITPNTDLQRNNITLAAGHDLSSKVKVTTNVAYTNNSSKNRPTFNRGSSSYILYTMPANINSQLLKDYWIPGYEGRQQFSQDQGSTDNPYFVAHQLTNGYNRHHVTGNVQLTMELAKGLTLMGRTGIDWYTETDEAKRAFSSIENPYGAYYVGNVFGMERNTDFLLTYKKNLKRDFAFFVSVGGNSMDQRSRNDWSKANSLEVIGLYTIGNATAGTLSSQSAKMRKHINSLYAMGELSYKGYAFLDLTARNDWSSALPANNNSYFYPSASLSLIVSDMLKIEHGPMSYAKLRVNASQVGNDTYAYNLYNTYGFQSSNWGDQKLVDFSSVLKNYTLKPEISTSYEIGADLKFFNNRLGIDATWYTTSSRNQILNMPTTSASGYTTRVINAGEIRNRGIEIGIHGTPVSGRLIWDIGANFTRNRSKAIELMPGITTFSMGSAEGLQYQVREGQAMGDMYGNTWTTVPDGPFKGKELLDQSGHSQTAADLVKIGNYNPDFSLGITNTFTYGHFTLNTLIDYRQGGKFFSYMFMNLLSDGRTKVTLKGRDPEHGGLNWNDGTNDRTDGMIEDGYVEDGNGNYVKNTNITDPESFYGDYYWKMHARNTFSATYVKLREVSLTYLFSKAQTGKLPVSNLSISLIARNLFSWSAAGQGYDPETAMTIKDGAITPGTASWSLPYTRTYGVKLGLNF